MAELAQEHKDQFKRIKQNIENAYQYFQENYENWHKYKKFLYIRSLTDRDIRVLGALDKPQLDFNELEAYVSRLKGEFSKQEPSIKVSASPTANEELAPALIKAIEGHTRSIEKAARAKGMASAIYDDMLSGGFSVAKVLPDYVDEMSFEQEIIVERTFDPTLCGFDPLARERHKGDANYCFELYIKRAEELKEIAPHIDLSRFKFSTDFEGFTWSYRGGNEDLVIIADYYEKKRQKIKIVQLTNKQVMSTQDYEKFLLNWELEGRIEQPPQVIGKPRNTFKTTIVRYRIVESEVIAYKKTNFKYLPLIFFDANSQRIRKALSTALQQYTRPYFYQAQGIQRLKNFAGNTLANELENMVQHKFTAPLEGIPEQYEEAYINVQKPATLIYNQFYNENPEIRLDRPTAIPRIPIPPEIAATFTGASQITQTILGSYDASLGINKNQLSGKAIVEGATQSNATAMPIVMGYMEGWNQIAQIILDLIPKYLVTPRSIPVIGTDGERTFIKINEGDGPTMQYDPLSLNVEVKAGVNFEIQQQRALQTIIALGEGSPTFNQIINNTPEGMKVLLSNISIRGIEYLREIVDKYFKNKAQQPPQPDPEMMALQLQAQRQQDEKMNQQEKNQLQHEKNIIQAAGVVSGDKGVENDRLKIMGELNARGLDREMELAKSQAEEDRTAVNLALKTIDMDHRHEKDNLETINKINNKGDKDAKY